MFYFLILVDKREWLQRSLSVYLVIYLSVYVCFCLYVSCLTSCLWKTEDVYLIMIMFISDQENEMKLDDSPFKWLFSGRSQSPWEILPKALKTGWKLVLHVFHYWSSGYFSTWHVRKNQTTNEEIEDKKAKWQNCRSRVGIFCYLNSLVPVHSDTSYPQDLKKLITVLSYKLVTTLYRRNYFWTVWELVKRSLV